MFKRIANIRDFGVFTNFSGGSLPEFAAFNLIYGWNYSGKTTLSRVFRCLEVGALNSNHPTARFEVLHADGTQHDQTFTQPCNVRMYNEDFRKEHLLWDDTSGFHPILLLGAENIERRKELESKSNARAEIEERRATAAATTKRLDDKIRSAETECAGHIAKELPVGRFDRRHLQPIISAWNGALPEALTAEQIHAARTKITAEQKDELPNLVISKDTIGHLWHNSTALLAEQLGSTATIARLVDHPDVATWVEQGRHLHEGKTRCEFCEGPLGLDRVAALNAHFSDAFDSLKIRINASLVELSSRKIELSGHAYMRSAFYADLHKERSDAGLALAQERDAFNNSIDALIRSLKEKLANPFEVIEPPGMEPDLTPLFEAVQRFQNIIDDNNRRTFLFSSLRNEAIATLKSHYAAEAMRRIDRFTLQRQMTEQEAVAQRASTELATLDEEIRILQADLSNAAKGAEAINDTLLRFFGKADIQIAITDDKRYLLMRGKEPARNLSEGERTAIAFCYFVTKLMENGNALSQTIVYIDDPISSLDAHHFLHVCAFIKSTFYRKNPAAPHHECLAKQLFVSTHSHEFFHVLLNWMGKTSKGMHRTWMIERTDANGLCSSRLITCPDPIKNYGSEYLFLFHQIADYADNPSGDYQVIFNLGNMTRRFIEGYSAFKYLEHRGIDGSIDYLITDPVDAERARKFMHHYSHALSRGNGMRLPDMSEAAAVVKMLLEAVRKQDPIHYSALDATRGPAN